MNVKEDRKDPLDTRVSWGSPVHSGPKGTSVPRDRKVIEETITDPPVLEVHPDHQVQLVGEETVDIFFIFLNLFL